MSSLIRKAAFWLYLDWLSVVKTSELQHEAKSTTSSSYWTVSEVAETDTARISVRWIPATDYVIIFASFLEMPTLSLSQPNTVLEVGINESKIVHILASTRLWGVSITWSSLLYEMMDELCGWNILFIENWAMILGVDMECTTSHTWNYRLRLVREPVCLADINIQLRPYM